MINTTNAGPVLPRLPDHDGWSDRPYWQASSMFAYGRECIEQVAGPLRERIAALERDLCAAKSQPLIDELAECFSLGGADADGNGTEWRAVHAVRSVRQLRQDYDAACDEAEKLRERVKELERQKEGLLQQHCRDSFNLRALCEQRDHLKAELARLRAESTIEWEPGRSYTTAELLRRAICRTRVRRGRSLWPSVMSLFAVGSTVAHYLCRWAGRDPDTGAAIEETK
jgi:hypothetical protein